MLKMLIGLIFITSLSANAGEIFKIEIGKDYNHYSDSDLKRRVWELERAVYQLQMKVFDLEMNSSKNNLPQGATWVCKTEAMGEKFTATGASKAVAMDTVMEKCKASPTSGNGFHCREPRCEQ